MQRRGTLPKAALDQAGAGAAAAVALAAAAAAGSGAHAVHTVAHGLVAQEKHIAATAEAVAALQPLLDRLGAAQPSAGPDSSRQPAAPQPASPALAAAHAALLSGAPATALGLVAALPAAQRQELPARQLQALCHIKLAGRPCASQAWHKVLGLPAGSSPTSAADIRRQFKRLAALVHPDKCAWAGAGEAFASLRAAADSLLEAAAQAEGEQAGRGSTSNKRKRTSSGGGRATAAGSDSLDGSDEEDGWEPDGGGFPWWEEWDDSAPQPEAAAAAAAAAAAQAGERGAAAGATGAAERHRPGLGGAAASGAEQQQAQRSTDELDLEQLAAMPLDELRAEVRRRQAALLSPPLDAAGRRVPLPQLQVALRQARTLLADRVAAEAAAAAAVAGGGFL
ncbi:hypothetical protein ABPG75_002156 [Micractinium tetrahymenae]